MALLSFISCRTVGDKHSGFGQYAISFIVSSVLYRGSTDRSNNQVGQSIRRSLSSEIEVDRISKNLRHQHAALHPAVILVRRNHHLDM